MLMQATFAGEEKIFFDRLDFINLYKEEDDNFKSLKIDIDHARQKSLNRHSLDIRSQQLLEILGFFEGIALYLTPTEYMDLFNGHYVSQFNLKEIFPLAQSAKLEKTDLCCLMEKPYAFNKSVLNRYLTDLRNILEQHSLELPILVHNERHSVFLKYSNSSAAWHYVDVNDFNQYPEHPLYYQEINNEKLVESIFGSLSGHSETVILNMVILTNQQDNSPSFFKAPFAGLDGRYPINVEHANLSNGNGVGLLHIVAQTGHVDVAEVLLEQKGININSADKNGATPLCYASQNGQISIVKLLLKQSSIDMNAAGADGTTPFYVACKQGHVEIVKVFLQHPEVRINQANHTGSTPLYIACQHGHTEIVKHLVSLEKIEINRPGLRNHTPLMVACLSPLTQEKPIIFDSLIEKGADLTHKNDAGETAFDIAVSTMHRSAIHSLLKAFCSQLLKWPAMMSQKTQQKVSTLIAENKIATDLAPKIIDYLHPMKKILLPKLTSKNNTFLKSEKYGRPDPSGKRPFIFNEKARREEEKYLMSKKIKTEETLYGSNSN